MTGGRDDDRYPPPPSPLLLLVTTTNCEDALQEHARASLSSYKNGAALFVVPPPRRSRTNGWSSRNVQWRSKKQASKVVASLGFTGYNARSPSSRVVSVPLSRSFFCHSLFPSRSSSLTHSLTHSHAHTHIHTLSLSFSLRYARALSLDRPLPPYLYLARSHLFVAGLGMLSWDSAAGFSEGTLPGPRPYGGHSRAQHYLVHDAAGTSRAPMSDRDHVRHTQKRAR